MNTLTGFSSLALERRLDLATYCAMMSYPTWNYLMQAVVATRSYEVGLERALLLLHYTEENRDKLSEKEYESNLIQLYPFILGMLDALDRWEEYLATWESIRSNTQLALTYDKGARKCHGTRLEPFILQEDAHTLYVHFLWWGTLHRKEVIERKLARKQAGKKLGNLLHASQDQLSVEEIRHRLDRIKEQAQYAGEMQRRLDWIVGMARRATRAAR